MHFPLLLVLVVLHAKEVQFVAGTDLDVAAIGEAIGRMESELAKLTNQSATVLKRIDGLAKSGIKLMSIISPVAKFALGALLEALFKPESPEHKAIVQLGKQMSRGFKHLEVQISQKFDEFECWEVSEKYDNKVVFKLKLLYDKFHDLFTKPTTEALVQEYLDEFVAGCKTANLDLMPTKILKFIDQKVRENCLVSDMSPLEPSCKGIGGHDPPCYLKAYRDGNQHRREPLLAFVDQVGRDMLKLEITTAFCIFHSSNHSDDYRRTLLHEVGTNVEHISAHMKMMPATWPNTITKYAIDQNEMIREEFVKKAIEDGNDALLNEIAESIAKQARERGPVGFNYQAHLWSSHVPHRLFGGAVEVKAWAATCTNEYYCQKLHREGADIVLYRYHDDESTANFVEQHAQKWIEANKGNIKNALFESRPQSHFDDQLGDIYKRFPEIDNYFGGAILINHIGGILSPGEGISTNPPASSSKMIIFVRQNSFAIEYREHPVEPMAGGAQIFVQKKLILFLGDRVSTINSNLISYWLAFVRNVMGPTRVRIVGTPKAHNARQFVVNFKCTDAGGGIFQLCSDGEILLHFNPRFNAEFTQNAVILNSWGTRMSSDPYGKREMEWLDEERASHFPFRPGQKFTLEFEAKKESGYGHGVAVEISIDGKRLHKYVYRNILAGNAAIPNLGFQILEIKGDLELEGVDFP